MMMFPMDQHIVDLTNAINQQTLTQGGFLMVIAVVLVLIWAKIQ